MPSRTSPSPGRVPRGAYLLVYGLGGLPECEVPYVLLLVVVLGYAGAWPGGVRIKTL